MSSTNDAPGNRKPNCRRVCKLRRATISLFMSVCLSVRPRGTTHLPLDEFSWNLLLESFFRKPVENIQISVKFDNNNRHFTYRPTYIYGNIRTVHLRMRNASGTSSRQNQNTHLTRTYNNFEPKAEKYCGAGQATDENTAHAHCMLDN